MTIATRIARARRGPTLTCKGWPQEAARRMLMNNLDRDVAERPDDLIVLTCDPGIGVLRHADAGYPEAIATAARHGLHIPMHEEREC